MVEEIIAQILASLTLGNPVALLVNLIISTIVGGIVFLVVVEVLAKAFSEEASPLKPFGVVLIINIINLLGLLAIIAPFLAGIPLAGIVMMIIPLLIWIVLVKGFFSDMEMVHVLVIAVVGYVLSILLFPYLTGMVLGIIPPIA